MGIQDRIGIGEETAQSKLEKNKKIGSVSCLWASPSVMNTYCIFALIYLLYSIKKFSNCRVPEIYLTDEMTLKIVLTSCGKPFIQRTIFLPGSLRQ